MIGTDSLDAETIRAFRTACELTTALKKEKRAGWLLRGLDPADCESVGDHSFGVAFLTLVLLNLTDHELDEARCLKLALLHDIAEAVVGDIPPSDPRVESKLALETEAIRTTLARHEALAPLAALWQEYAERATPEARFVKQIDQLELIMQAKSYQHEAGLDVASMLQRAGARITDAPLKDLLTELTDPNPDAPSE